MSFTPKNVVYDSWLPMPNQTSAAACDAAARCTHCDVCVFAVGAPLAADDVRVVALEAYIGQRKSPPRLPRWDMPEGAEVRGFRLMHLQTLLWHVANLLYDEIVAEKKALQKSKDPSQLSPEERARMKPLKNARRVFNTGPVQIAGFNAIAGGATVDALQLVSYTVTLGPALLPWVLRYLRWGANKAGSAPLRFDVNAYSYKSKEVKAWRTGVHKDKRWWYLQSLADRIGKKRVEQEATRLFNFFVFNCAVPFLAAEFLEEANGSFQTIRVRTGTPTPAFDKRRKGAFLFSANARERWYAYWRREAATYNAYLRLPPLQQPPAAPLPAPLLPAARGSADSLLSDDASRYQRLPIEPKGSGDDGYGVLPEPEVGGYTPGPSSETTVIRGLLFCDDGSARTFSGGRGGGGGGGADDTGDL